MRQGAQGRCTGMALRDGMGREVQDGVLAGRFFTTESPRKPPELREGSKGGSWVSKQWVKPQGAELDKTRVRSLNFVTMAMRSHRGVMMSFVLYTCSE